MKSCVLHAITICILTPVAMLAGDVPPMPAHVVGVSHSHTLPITAQIFSGRVHYPNEPSFVAHVEVHGVLMFHNSTPDSAQRAFGRKSTDNGNESTSSPYAMPNSQLPEVTSFDSYIAHVIAQELNDITSSLNYSDSSHSAESSDSDCAIIESLSSPHRYNPYARPHAMLPSIQHVSSSKLLLTTCLPPLEDSSFASSKTEKALDTLEVDPNKWYMRRVVINQQNFHEPSKKILSKLIKQKRH